MEGEKQIFRTANIQYKLILRRVCVSVAVVEKVHVISALWVCCMFVFMCLYF